MVDFKESFIKGLDHAEKVEEQRRVIDEIVQRMIDEVSEATDGKLNIELQSQSAYEKTGAVLLGAMFLYHTIRMLNPSLAKERARPLFCFVGF